MSANLGFNLVIEILLVSTVIAFGEVHEPYEFQSRNRDTFGFYFPLKNFNGGSGCFNLVIEILLVST